MYSLRLELKIPDGQRVSQRHKYPSRMCINIALSVLCLRLGLQWLACMLATPTSGSVGAPLYQCQAFNLHTKSYAAW